MLNFKRLISAIVLVMSAIAPIAVSADSGNSGKDQGSADKNFCVRITNVRSEINSKLTQLENNRGKNHSDILKKLNDKKTTRVGEVQKMRGDTEKIFGDAVAKIVLMRPLTLKKLQ